MARQRARGQRRAKRIDIVDTGTKEVPTPLEVTNAVIAHGIVHRTPSTDALYLYSPTKTGVDNVPGQGVGKSEFQRFVTAVAGANVVDTKLTVNEVIRSRCG